MKKTLMALIVAPVLVALLGVEAVKAQEGLIPPKVTFINAWPNPDAELYPRLAFSAGARAGDRLVLFNARVNPPVQNAYIYTAHVRDTGDGTVGFWQRVQESYELPNPLPPPTGHYGNLEVPADGSFQSGIGFISGWRCTAWLAEHSSLAFYLNGNRIRPSLRRLRADTEAVCGDSRNGFVMPVNWNLLGDGQHHIQVFNEENEDTRVLAQESRFTVTTLGEEFVRGASGECTITDFPSTGETATFRWQEPVQGLVLTETE